MPADSQHVMHMKGFVPPESERVNLPSTMQEAADKAAARAEKKDDTAVAAEQETKE